MKKQIIALGAALGLVAAVGVGSTLAYLTDTTNTVTNTFTVGKVDIELAETVDENVATKNQVGGYDFEKLLPGSSYEKKPVVTVDKDSADCYVFVKITGDVSMTDMDMKQWTNVGNDVYRYNAVLKAEDSATVFTKVTIDGELKENANIDDITIVACAVQKANLTEEEALKQAKFEK